MLLSRESILGAQDRTFKDVNCPEWGGKVRVQSLTGAERDAFEDSIMKRDKDGGREVVTANLRAKLVALAVVDQEGNRLFTDEDVAALGRKNAAALDRLFMVAQKLSGISKDDVEEMVKNSGAAPSGSSDLPSPANSE